MLIKIRSCFGENRLRNKRKKKRRKKTARKKRPSKAAKIPKSEANPMNIYVFFNKNLPIQKEEAYASNTLIKVENPTLNHQ